MVQADGDLVSLSLPLFGPGPTDASEAVHLEPLAPQVAGSPLVLGEVTAEVFLDGDDFDCLLISIEDMCRHNGHLIQSSETLNLYCWFLLCEAGWRLTPFISPEVPEVYCARVWSNIRSRMQAIKDGPDSALRGAASEYLERMDAMEMDSGYDSDDYSSVDHCTLLREMLGFGHYFGTFPLGNGVTSLHMQTLADIGAVTSPTVVGWVNVPADGSVPTCTEVVYNRHMSGMEQHWGYIVGMNGHMSWWNCLLGRSEISLGLWNVLRPVSIPPCRVVAMTCSEVFFGPGQSATTESCAEAMYGNDAPILDCPTNLHSPVPSSAPPVPASLTSRDSSHTSAHADEEVAIFPLVNDMMPCDHLWQLWRMPSNGYNTGDLHDAGTGMCSVFALANLFVNLNWTESEPSQIVQLALRLFSRSAVELGRYLHGITPEEYSERLWYSAEAESLSLRWQVAEQMDLGDDFVQPSAMERAMAHAWSDVVNCSGDVAPTLGGPTPLHQNGAALEDPPILHPLCFSFPRCRSCVLCCPFTSFIV